MPGPQLCFSETAVGDLMVRAGLSGFPSLSSRWIEQQEDDKQAEMMDERGRMIFQSICQPQFLSQLQETGLMSWSIQAGFCHCVFVRVCVCVCVKFMHAGSIQYLLLLWSDVGTGRA